MTRRSSAAARARFERTRRNAALVTQNAEPEGESRLGRSWRRLFLVTLGQTSDIAAACKVSGASLELAYSARREEPDFAIAWRRALLEGYENLELETLFYLRTGKAPHAEAKFDVVNAIRLIKGQADVAARERAAREDDDEADVLDSIDRMLDGMRERAAANATILEEPADEPG